VQIQSNAKLRRFILNCLVGIATLVLALAGCSVTPVSTSGAQPPKNIIIMFADGAASTQWDFGRYSSKVLRRQPFAVTDIVFREGVLGLLSTEPNNAYVVDSAASASAMSTGYKVNNFAVAVTPDGKSVPTLMEIAKAKGKRIGLVTTANVYDATPAAFSIHAKTRDDSQLLVDQYLALEPDVLMGGARTTSCRMERPAANARTVRTSSPLSERRATRSREIRPSSRPPRARRCSSCSPKRIWISSSTATRRKSRRPRI